MIRTLSFIVLLFTFVACQQDTTEPSRPDHGGEQTSAGCPRWKPWVHVYSDQGEPEDCFKILKDHGINSIRLRTWLTLPITTVAIAAKKRR